MTQTCRICRENSVQEFFDFARQPLSNSLVAPDGHAEEYEFRLAVGFCKSCTMTQQLEVAPRDRVFSPEYPYRSSESAGSRRHFEEVARTMIETELTGPDPFLVEVGSNDGIMLRTVKDSGIRHLGIDPAENAAQVADAEGVRVTVDLFGQSSADRILQEDGPADVIFSANTISHIPDIREIFEGARALLHPGGIFVFEDRYVCDIIENTYFDQVYDAHFYMFSVRSVRAMAETFGFDLIDAQHIPMHGGSMRYTVARSGERTPKDSVEESISKETESGFSEYQVYEDFGVRVRNVCSEIVNLLRRIRKEGKTVVGYGATAKSATVMNYCGIGPDLVPFICDSTEAKQGKLTPGSHIPIRPPEEFSNPFPDYALLFAWTHAEEIVEKEWEFRQAGGKWIVYVPEVRIID